MKRAIVLLSGGLDSATVLAVARRDGFDCHAISFDYGQRHRCELDAATRVAKALGCATHRTITIDLRAIGGSALTDKTIDVPKDHAGDAGIPITYVPARNLLFLSVAAGVAEVEQAEAIYIGVNAVDYSGYPDCRPDFIAAFAEAARLGTRMGVEGEPVRVETPLVALAKPEIIALGVSLGVDYGLTVSCYDPDSNGHACSHCDSCIFRMRGFAQAGLPDPTRYAQTH